MPTELLESTILCVGWKHGERVHAHVIDLRRFLRRAQKWARNDQIPVRTPCLDDQRMLRCRNRDTLGPNQVCTLFGAQPGSDTVGGNDYLEAGYGITSADIWRRNLVVIIAFLIFFLFTQAIVIEYLSVRPLR